MQCHGASPSPETEVFQNPRAAQKPQQTRGKPLYRCWCRPASSCPRRIFQNLFRTAMQADSHFELRKFKGPYLNAVQHEGCKHLLHGLWWSGLRLEESLNLWWDRFDRISIDLTSGRPLLRIPAEREKGNQDRLYPVATEFAEMFLAVPVKDRRGPYFTVLTKKGEPYSRSRHSVGKIIAELGRRAGIVVNAHQKTGEKQFKSE